MLRYRISPSEPATRDYFVHVLQTSDANSPEWPDAAARDAGDAISVTVAGRATVTFAKTGPLAAQIELHE